MRKSIALIFFLFFAVFEMRGQETPKRVKLEIGSFFFFGVGVGNSNNQIDNRNLAHLFENTRRYSVVHAPISVGLRDSVSDWFIQWQLMRCSYGVDNYMNTQLLQEITPSYQVSLQSKYSSDVIDDSPSHISATIHQIKIGKLWMFSKRFGLLPFAGFSYTKIRPSTYNYAFKENDSNVFFIHSYASKSLRGIGYSGGLNLRCYFTKELYLDLMTSFHYFQRKGSLTERVLDMNDIEVQSTKHDFLFKTATSFAILSLGVVM